MKSLAGGKRKSTFCSQVFNSSYKSWDIPQERKPATGIGLCREYFTQNVFIKIILSNF